MSLRGRVALVTGSTSGIGLGIARALAAAGADVMLNGFGDAAAIEAVLGEITREFGVRALYDSTDLRDPAAIATLVRHTRAGLGAPDILVNNAGIQYVAEIVDFPPDRWDAVIAINLSAAFHAMQHAIPAMREKGWGRIINIASAHGLVASGQKSAYVAAKHGIIGLTKAAAIEVANDGITVNAICPGWVLTPLVEQQLAARASENGIDIPAAKAQFLAEKQPMARFTTADQIGAFAVFLCGEMASTITGAPLSIDGGWVAR